MLKWMRIKNLALVGEADIEFGPGFNVISGETGAGKSVLIGGAALLLGERADKSSIRNGAERCEVSGEFVVEDFTLKKSIASRLSEAGVDDNQGTLSIRRVITNSSSRNFINDTPVTLQTLKEIGEQLVDIHGATEHQTLLRCAVQMARLDRYAKLDALLDSCEDAWNSLRKLRERREAAFSQMPNQSDAERLREEIAEIERAKFHVGEDAEVSARHSTAANSRQIVELTSKAVAALSESESSVSDSISSVRRILQDLERFDAAKGEEFTKACESALATVRELSRDISCYASSVDMDEREFASLEDRLRILQTLKRRYGPTLEDVLLRLEKSKERLTMFESSAQIREDLDNEERELLAKHRQVCASLRKARGEASKKLSKELVKELERLDFLKSSLSISILDAEAGPRGSDKVEFMFSANPGQPEKPLRDVASSGEMSRVMLAIKCVLAEADSTPLLIFDEIDVNIGGRTAIKVGSGLAKLGASHQVLCISHLPQVAAKGHSHFLVEKTLSGGKAITEVSSIDGDRRVNEISRMLGGGKAATAHARELLET